MKALDAFAGAGGWDVAARRAGITVDRIELWNPATLFFGARANWTGWVNQGGVLMRKVEPWEAAAIQTFPADYPWQGTKSEVMTQIGNAVPPTLAAAIIAALTR